MLKNLPKISCIIITKNESRFVRECISSILNNGYPHELIEVLVSDGMSSDGTQEIVREIEQNDSRVKLLVNPKIIQPSGMNVGIEASTGEIIFMLGCHTKYEPNYLVECVQALMNNPKAWAAGGVRIDSRRNNSLTAQGIELAITSLFGSGGSAHRVLTDGPPRVAKTAPYAGYRKEVFSQIGSFDERMARSLDTEFNRRLRERGGQILVVPQAKAHYSLRSTFKEFVNYFYVNGKWLLIPLEFGVKAYEVHHLAPMILVGLGGLLLLSALLWNPFWYLFILYWAGYFACLVTYFVKRGIATRQVFINLYASIFVLMMHISSGIGAWVGFFRVLKSKLFFNQATSSYQPN